VVEEVAETRVAVGEAAVAAEEDEAADVNETVKEKTVGGIQRREPPIRMIPEGILPHPPLRRTSNRLQPLLQLLQSGFPLL
jgi:hypothetical protein